MRLSLTILWLLPLITGCHLIATKKGNQDKGEPVARVYDQFLYKEDLTNIVPDELAGNDSLAFIQNYINVWAKEQLMLYKAEFNLTESKKDFEKQITQYRNDLLKFTYRQDYISQNLDTTITDAELEEYYETGENVFRLKQDIVKARYIVVDKEAPSLKEAQRWFRSDFTDDIIELDDFALQYAFRFSLQDSNWVSVDRIRELLRLGTDWPEDFYKEGKYIERTDSLNLYLLDIIEYKVKGDRAPLEYYQDVITSILINKRKLKLIDDLEQNLLNDALSKKEFEVY